MANDIFYLEELNDEQKKAVQLKANAVVSAGAGSGKTKVLSKRFVYLLLERKIKIEKILALTFTKKAANEMYERIHKELVYVEKNLKSDKKNLAKAVLEDFTKANISTLDSFCSKIARSACKQFGISPDFVIDQKRSDDIARDSSLSFFMKHRNDKNIISLISTSNFEYFIQSFFEAFLKYVLVTKPIDIKKNKKLFEKKLEDLFQKCVSSFDKNAELIFLVDDSNKKDKLLSPLKENLSSLGKLPDGLESILYDDWQEILADFTCLDMRKGNKRDETLKDARIAAKDIRNVSNEILSLKSTFDNKDIIFELFDLLDELQNEYISKKISEGVLNYADVSQLAVDALLQDKELRNFYKNEFDSIMIDEFQDNNELQRNLLFLISEKKDLASNKIPKAEELISDKLFFVGDDKQSIYLFRGADVSVFKKLDDEFTQNKTASLDINYRTEAGLINFFNYLFKNVFIDKSDFIGQELSELEEKVLDHEASFSKTKSFQKTSAVSPSVNLFIAANNLNDGEEFLTAYDAESFTIAKEILSMVQNKVAVRDRDKDGKSIARPCKYSDFAILFRVSTHQSSIEKYLRRAGIPYKTVQQKGIFFDAAINDMLALINLVLHPNDTFIYTQVLRSPFSKLDDVELAKILMEDTFTEPFVVNENNFEEASLKKIKSLRELFLRLVQYSKELSSAEFVTKIWYDEAYRYLILQNKDYKRYLELYDYLFEIARTCDEQGLSLEGFLNQVDAYIQNEDKLDDMEIPVGLYDDDNSVKLLTIHKSKGLEFPIVCLPFCADNKRTVRLDQRVFYSEEDALSISMQIGDEQNKNENVIFNNARYFENKKANAELRRLLYVGLTRAESHIIMTGIKDSRAKDKSKSGYKSEKELFDAMLSEFSLSNDKGEAKDGFSFYSLIISALSDEVFENTKDVFHIRELKPISIKDQFAFGNNYIIKEKTSAREKLDKIINAKVKKFSPAEKKYFTASHLDDLNAKKVVLNFDKEEKFDMEEDTTERISAGDLGSLTHAVIEARLNNKNFFVEEAYRDKVLFWCDNFFNSKLAKLALNSKMLKTEYSIITKYKDKTVIGQIDLVFENNGIMYIVDYKTDSFENPSIHKTQLEVYKQACCNLFSKKEDEVKAFLIYLRSGNIVEL